MSHSPNLITSALDDSLIFLRPWSEEQENQGFVIGRNDETNAALHQLGQSVGVLSLGRKIVLIEGEGGSLDKKVYSQVLENRFPDLILMPTGGKESVKTFGDLTQTVLDKTVWGVRFFMLADRDTPGVDDFQWTDTNDARLLPRYHIENYFLDETTISRAFQDIEDQDSWLTDSARIRAELISCAKASLNYVTALSVAARYRFAVGNVDIMAKGVEGLSLDELTARIINRARNEATRVNAELETSSLATSIETTVANFSAMLDSEDDSWKVNFPAKQIVSRFSAKACISKGRFQNLYIGQAKKDDEKAFAEIFDIFRHFSAAA